MISSQEIRKSFLNFFNSKNHDIVSSSSIIVKDDPSLMFTNAGMNQFKNIFLNILLNLSEKMIISGVVFSIMVIIMIYFTPKMVNS